MANIWDEVGALKTARKNIRKKLSLSRDEEEEEENLWHRVRILKEIGGE